MHVSALTDIGLTRSDNQDAYKVTEVGRNLLAIVCDGMGGAKAGNVASRLTADEVAELTKEELSQTEDIKDARSIIRRAMRTVNRKLYRMAKNDPNLSGMGTTIVCAFVTDEGVLVMNIGDSRAYLVSDGAIEQVTRDHSMVEEMIRNGQITREESRSHPGKHIITMAIGPDDDILPDAYEFTLKKEDRLLLCTDGLHNMLTDEEILDIISGASNGDEACRRLIDAANAHGGRDNITAVLCTPAEV